MGALVFAAALVQTGCDGEKNGAARPSGPVLGPEHRFAIAIGSEIVQMRLAVHESERSQGLMHVTQMPENEGMLFVWAQPQRMSFYMRNTRLPLDIGFINADGILREIYPMYPGVEDTVRSADADLKFALEMNQGWFSRHDVKPGAKLDLDALRAALAQRGYRADKYVGH